MTRKEIEARIREIARKRFSPVGWTPEEEAEFHRLQTDLRNIKANKA